MPTTQQLLKSSEVSLNDIRSRYSDSEVESRNRATINNSRGIAATRMKDAETIYRVSRDSAFDESSWHHDSAPTVSALARGLELVDREVMMIEPSDKPLASGQCIPIKIDVDEAADEYVHYQVESVGSWKRGSPSTSDIPLSEASLIEWRDPIYEYYGGYTLSPKEIAMVARAGMGRANIDIASIKASVLNQAAREKQNELIGFGDGEVGLPGWFNHPQSLVSYGRSAITDTSDPHQDLLTLSFGARTAQALEPYRIAQVQPDAVEMSISLYEILGTKPYTFIPQGSTNPIGTPMISVLQQFLTVNPHIKSVNALADLNPSNVTRYGMPSAQNVVFYRRDPRFLRFQFTTNPLTMLTPKEFGFGGILRAAYFATAGTLLYYLNSGVRLELPNA